MTEIRCSVEVREDTNRTGPGRLYGVLMAEGTSASDRAESFAPGALSWPDDGVLVNVQHDRRQPVMRATPERRGSEVVIDAPLPDTQRGRDAATMIRNGTMRGLSVEFRARRQRYDGGRRVILDAMLKGAGLVDDPSYGASRVEVRQKGRGRRWWL